MTVINQVLLPNLWISSSLQYTRAGHSGWYPDVSCFGECNCVRLCNFACNSKLHGSTLLFVFFSFFFCWQCLSSAYRSVIVTHLLLLLRAVGECLQTGVELFIFQEGLFSIKVFSLTEASLAPVYRERERETPTVTALSSLELQMAYRLLNLSYEWHHPLPARSTYFLQDSRREGGRESIRWCPLVC